MSRDGHDTLSGADQRLAHVVLSRLVGEHVVRGYSDLICRMIGEIAEVDGPWPDPDNVQERLDLDIDALWRAATKTGGVLDVSLITRFYPKRIWADLVDVVRGTPVDFDAAVKDVLTAWAAGTSLDGLPREPGPLAPGTLEPYINARKRFAKEICNLRKLIIADHNDKISDKAKWSLGLQKDDLEDWTADAVPPSPTLKQIKAIARETDRSAPPLIAARKVLHGFTKKIQRQRRLTGGRRRIGLFAAYRNRAIFAIACLGFRKKAIRLLTLSDVIWEHHFGDNTVGPALRVRHLKGLPGLERYAGIPPELAGWIREYIDYMAEEGFVLTADQPLWQQVQRSRWGTKTRASLGLVDIAVVTSIAPYVNNGRRYSPHTLRHLAEKVAWRAGWEWMSENLDVIIQSDAVGLPSSPQTFCDVQLDHALNDIKDRYKDIKSEAGRAHWRRVAAIGMWEYLWGEKGARTAPDLDRIAAAKRALDDADLARDRATLELERLTRDRVALIESEGSRIEAARVDADSSQAESVRVLTHVILEAHSAMLRLAALSDRIATAVSVHERAVSASEAARDRLGVAYRTRVAVSDDLSDEELADLEHLGAVPEPEHGAAASSPTRRAWVDAVEFRWAVGVNSLPASTLRRWIATGRLRHPAGHPENLFNHNPDGSLTGVDHCPGKHDTRLIVDELPLDRYPALVVERLRWIQTQLWPAVSSGTRNSRHGRRAKE